ncbi:MAG: MFS transporter [Proteobacteria bacterium]|nr:MFS transporter [Pseudomonadota bacterium]
MRVARPGTLLLLVCLAEIASMLGLATFPSLQPQLIKLWGLSNTEVGWINGIYYLGYLMAVPVLVSLTDRMVPKHIYTVGMILSGASALGFAAVADGFWTAMLFRTLAGIGLAGSYMPGLKMLSDHLELMAPGRDHSRAVAFYTSSFGIGSALSYFFAGQIADGFGWQAAFYFAGLGPLLGIVLALALLPGADPKPTAPDTHLLDFRPVFRSRRAMGFVLAYTAHNFELFALRSWIVSYLVFAAATGTGGGFGLTATAIAAGVNLLGMPSSVFGNELARRIGRLPTIVGIMGIAACVSIGIGFTANYAHWVVLAGFIVYGIVITADSSVITAGVVAAAPRGYNGATMAVHSSMGPLVFGKILDLAGRQAGVGETDVMPWVWAFTASAAVGLLGAAALIMLERRHKE